MSWAVPSNEAKRNVRASARDLHQRHEAHQSSPAWRRAGRAGCAA